MMSAKTDFRGVVVPMVTPVTGGGEVDLVATDRLVRVLIEAGVDGIFPLGTTGEGPSVPRAARLPMLQQVVRATGGRAKVYAGIGDTCLADAVAAGNQYLANGANAVVAMPPVYYPLGPVEMQAWFRRLLDSMTGPVIIYNIPSTTRVSIPLDLVEALLGHPRLAGLKDSENAPERHAEMLRRFGGRSAFSVFIGVGALMAQGLKSGAQGIVPSVGNLVPGHCVKLCTAAAQSDWKSLEEINGFMNRAAALYQKDRTLGQSLAALKGALHLLGVCGPGMLPPLQPLTTSEMEALREAMSKLDLLR